MTQRSSFTVTLTVSLTLSTVLTGTSSGQSSGTVAFTGVNVFPMATERMLADHTVVVVDGKIQTVGPTSETRVPDGATVVEATDRFLIPGLVDMHVHVRNAQDLIAYLANGVTTVADLGGPAARLTWRDRIAAGELIGPRLLVSRFIDGQGGRGRGIGTVEGVREAVRHAAESGYDYIKVYNSLTTAQFDASVAEANSHGMSLIGHGVREPGLAHILESGMAAVAHAEEYIYTLFRGCNARGRIPEAVELTRRTGAYVIPNLAAYEIITLQWGKPPVVDSLVDQPEYRFLHPSFRRSWRSGRYTTRTGSLEACLRFLRELTGAFAAAGIPLLLGTDSPGIPGMFPGYSIHNDMRNLIESGLSPYQVLAAGTSNAGRFIAETLSNAPTVGVIEPGAEADVILLDQNPVEDVANLKDPIGVMVGGTWWTAAQLRELLEQTAAEFDQASLRR